MIIKTTIRVIKTIHFIPSISWKESVNDISFWNCVLTCLAKTSPFNMDGRKGHRKIDGFIARFITKPFSGLLLFQGIWFVYP